MDVRQVAVVRLNEKEVPPQDRPEVQHERDNGETLLLNRLPARFSRRESVRIAAEDVGRRLGSD